MELTGGKTSEYVSSAISQGVSALPIRIQSGLVPKRIETGLTTNLRPHWTMRASCDRPKPVSIQLHEWVAWMRVESELSETTFSVDAMNRNSKRFQIRKIKTKMFSLFSSFFLFFLFFFLF